PISVDRARGEHQVGIDGWVGEIRGGRQVIDDVLALRSEMHTHPCRRKRRVSRDGHLVLYQRRGNAQGRARRRTRTVDFAPVAPRVGDVLEYRLAAVADGDAQRTGDLQFALALVTLVAVAAVGGADERLRLAVGAGEQVLVARIAGIHERQELVLALTQLGGDGLAILRRERAVAGAQGQLAHAQQHGIYRVERHFLLGQAA